MRHAAMFAAALLIVALPNAAFAQATVKCEFDGNATKVVVTNADNADRTCTYLCKYNIQGGEFQISGSASFKAGESRIVHDKPGSSRITGVKESTASCK